MFCPKCGTENPETGRFCRSCGTDLSGVSKALNNKSAKNEDLWGTPEDLLGTSSNQNDMWQMSPNSEKITNPDELFGAGVKGVIMGFGFLAVSMALLFTGVAGGKNWWWVMLFPAFLTFANGVSQILKANSMKSNISNANPVMQNQFRQTQQNLNLPPTQTEYVKPQSSIYETGSMVTPPSVTEQTTKQLQVNKEGETMTFPKQNQE